MNRIALGARVTVLAVLMVGAPQPARSLGTAFTYQGQLQQSGGAANGTCDFQFILFDAAGSGAPPTGGNQIGNTAADDVQLSNGLFTLSLDFGTAAFSTGADRWLQIAVRCPTGNGSYQTLTPRQPLTAAPFALFASNVADASVSSAKLAPGAVTTAQLATDAVTAAQIADGTITTNDLANAAVSTAKIGAGQVTAAKLAVPLSLTSSVAHTFVGAFDGISTGLNGVGVSGTANNGSNAFGVYGLANTGYGAVGSSTSGTGVLGQSSSGEGVKGTSSLGVGVLGEAVGDAGVKGTSDEDGVFGESTGESGVGVHGKADEGPDAAGVRGNSSAGTGVSGHSSSGVGVAGISTGGVGVAGVSGKVGGTGVQGIADDGGSARGVFGKSTQGVGVAGESTEAYGVVGTGVAGLFGVPNNSTGIGVIGITTLGDDGPEAAGVRGAAKHGRGVHGGSDSGPGVYGESDSGNGVYGKSVSAPAVYGESANRGVWGKSTGGSRGVTGDSASGDGVHGESVSGAGVVGVAHNVNSPGIFGSNDAGGNAGYFSGKVHVTGVITAGMQPFKIDHPLDPANKYLMHAAVESPDMKNIYDGIAVLDERGEAVIELPAWFEALNRDFRYQLTCIGGVAPVYIAEEVSDHQFRIAGGAHGLKVSWQVTGIRQDAFANAHPLVVEPDKDAQERGRYLYPVEAGMPASLSSDRARQTVAETQAQ